MNDSQASAAKSSNSRKRQIVVVIILIALLCLAVWLVIAIRGERSLTWMEEVKLPDGRVVTLTRHQEFRDADHDPGNYWFEYADPDTKENVRFESTRAFATMALFKRGSTHTYCSILHTAKPCTTPTAVPIHRMY